MIIEGFTYSAVEAGIRKQGRLDLGLIFSDCPAVVAGVFTTNRVKAAPVLIDMERMRSGRAQAILVNSGIANACTSSQGMEAALATGALVARALDIPEEMVQISSTGVIGEQLEVKRFEQAMAGLVAGLSADGYDKVARAIMTTDTVPKTASCEVDIDGRPVKIFGMAKGAGMIMPNMATMLSFVVTDAAVSHSLLQEMLRRSVDKSFNRITIDGDTSTNDMVLILANGVAGNSEIEPDTSAAAAFQGVLDGLLKDLALQIVKDGEGASKLVTIRVLGAVTDSEAEMAARTIANSPLVKTAFYGEDPNWGRIIGALGRSGAEFDQEKVDIFFDDVQMVENGLGLWKEAEAKAAEVLKNESFTVTVDLKAGSGAAEFYTCDFSVDYVKINADYRT
jgi:glutamate N-acetyltransferase/amino-acid N-acetyltransferase